ncbi:MAG: hypothetical protein HC881_12830 [Leptolyngbyaceae cyanobacterium SL_7_1]|nr:hypothetical protein [Leptolyngbyaceae cyanobacterium SL_7_1]
MATLSPQDEVIQNLACDPNAVRIKKLLIYVCNHYWESDLNQLHRFQLSELIQELMAIAPTIEQLRFQLNNAVQTINKRAEYALIANYLINTLTPLYGWVTPRPSVSLHPSVYGRIAQELLQDTESLRIKKLLFCACHQRWENNVSQLDAHTMVDLVQELHRVAVTPENIRLTLEAVVSSLNRPEVYQSIAERICHACRFYSSSRTFETTSVTAFAPPITPDQTGLIHSNSPDQNTVYCVDSHTQNTALDGMSEEQHFEPLPFQSKKTISELLINLFDLRLEIIKYANPLKAKMLMYSLLHGQPELNAEIWSAIKNYDLHTLLQNLLRLYKRFSYLETRLAEVAQSLPNPSSYLQASSAILRAIKPYYSGNVEGLSLDDEEGAAQSRQSLVDASTTAKPTDLTCQLSAEVSEFTRAIATSSNGSEWVASSQPSLPHPCSAQPLSSVTNDATLAVPPIIPS